ncbi:MAG: hypothetical protein U1A06_21375 [Hoeflea sp.]|nr:hypothetical protein [Hoeflea sp.]
MLRGESPNLALQVTGAMPEACIAKTFGSNYVLSLIPPGHENRNS